MEKSKRTQLFFLILLFCIFGANFFIPQSKVIAAENVFALEIQYPKVPGAASPQEFVNRALPEEIPGLYIKYVFNLILWLSGIIVLGALIFGGLRYLTAAGKPKALISANNQITAAFFGLLILLSSYIIFNILNPQLLILKVPKIEPAKIIQKPEVPVPETAKIMTSIETEIPFGKVIEENLFGKARVSRVKEIANNTFKLADEIKNKSVELKAKTEQCSCERGKGGVDSVCPGCAPVSCTSDPCEPARGEISKIEADILKKVSELAAWQAATDVEIKGLTSELLRLQRAEDFMKECPVYGLKSLSEILITGDYFEQQKWILRKIRLWPELSIVRALTPLDPVEWATFYCSVAGTIFEPIAELFPVPQAPEESDAQLPEEVAEKRNACQEEVRVGEVIERTKRLTTTLIYNLERLIVLDKAIQEAVSNFHTLISQCSSINCRPVCYNTPKGCVNLGCFGSPCPSNTISDQLKTIEMFRNDIEKVVKEKEGLEIGILPLIDGVVPELLRILDQEVRQPMKVCAVREPGQLDEPNVFLADCESAIGSLGPEGEILRLCCLEEKVYQECIDKCYLETGDKNYEKCLQGCLVEKSKAVGDEEIASCRNRLNFFCCNPPK